MNRLVLRKSSNAFMIGLMATATIAVLIPLVLIFTHLVKQGITSINLDFFIHIPKPVGETGGGMANGIVGSAILIGMASLIGLPVGILGAIYLSEFAGTRLAGAIRFSADVLSGVPSIITGMVVYALLVVPMKSFSAIAGSVALALIMIPIVLRTTEEQLKMVPQSLREASLALGVPLWRTTLKVTLRTAGTGVMTGILLSVARIIGETAPVMFTALGNQFWQKSLNEPIAALPLQIFTFAISPFEEWHRLAWAGALVLVVLMFTISLLARFFSRRKYQL